MRIDGNRIATDNQPMASKSRKPLRNLARGGGTLHKCRHNIFKAILHEESGVRRLGTYLRSKFFTLEPDWKMYAFTTADWMLADRILKNSSYELEDRLLELARAYVESNSSAILNVYQLSHRATRVFLAETESLKSLSTPELDGAARQSLFALRLTCAKCRQMASEEVAQVLARDVAPNEWCHSRLVPPLVSRSVNSIHPASLDRSLEYFLAGHEPEAEKIAIRLLLSSAAAKGVPLAYRLYVGLMGHPFDLLELVSDYVELAHANGEDISKHASEFLGYVAKRFPGTRAGDLAGLQSYSLVAADHQVDPPAARRLVERYGVKEKEANALALLGTITPFRPPYWQASQHLVAILCTMRAAEYPQPEQFRALCDMASEWSFVDGGKIVISILRSLYLVDREESHLELCDVQRLAQLFGGMTPFVATAPSATIMMDRLIANADDKANLKQQIPALFCAAEAAAGIQRLWINRLQWDLRALEDSGRFADWLSRLRAGGRIRHQYLSGVNWPWVEKVIRIRRLKPFFSFDGAYAILRMELETDSAPERLKHVLDRLFRGCDVETTVDKLIGEFEDDAPAFILRHFALANLMVTGRAANRFVAIHHRMSALELCIQRVGFGQYLSPDAYEREMRELTAELLLLNVNAGQFEIPWESFVNCAIDRCQEAFDLVEAVRAATLHDAASKNVDVPYIFRNGAKVEYRVRRSEVSLLHVVLETIGMFLDHPAFGLEMILSGRFRHNHLLQELQASVAACASMDIHPVTPRNVARLVGAYRAVIEKAVLEWCDRYLHTKREEKPNGLFNIIPDQSEVVQLVQNLSTQHDLREMVLSVTQWIRDRLRGQLDDAGEAFYAGLGSSLRAAFNSVRREQVQKCDMSYRTDDVGRVHDAVLDVLVRRLQGLKQWFGGLDSQFGGAVSLEQLTPAIEALFDNLQTSRTLSIECDQAARSIAFAPDEVKIAFDLLREVCFNAYKHAPGPDVVLTISKCDMDGLSGLVFANDVGVMDADESGFVEGARYMSLNESLTREGNSGRFKIAATAATLVKSDLRIAWSRQAGVYQLRVPMRSEDPVVRRECAY